MATNIKAKKKKGTYDNKILLWIIVGLAALVAIIVTLAIVITVTGNYVAKVGGKKIYTYEYNYFLREAVSEEYQANFDSFKPENYDDMSEEEQNKVFEDFFTEERRKTCETNALEKARVFKAEYKIAEENGFKLNAGERSQMKASIDSYIAMYMNYGYSQEYAVYLMTQGAMKLSEYKDFMILQSAIERYKSSLKEDIDVTDAEIRAKYDEEPDDYRTLTARVFKFALPVKPTVPKDDSGKENPDDEKYKKDLEDYNAQIENFRKLAAEMKEAFDADNTFTLYDYDMVTFTPNKDEEGKDKIKAEKATFSELCTSQSSWASASSNKGVVTVNNSNSSNVTEIDDFVLRVQWNDKRDGFVVGPEKEKEKEEDETSTGGSSSDAETTEKQVKSVKPLAIEIIETKNDDGDVTGLYMVRVEDINDIDSDAAEGSADGLNTVKSTIKTTILEDKAVAELEAKVEAGGSKYALKSIKDKRLAEVMKEVLG